MDKLTMSKKSVILIVADDQTMRSLLRQILEDEGYTVVEAKDGGQLLSAYPQIRPDLIIMDITAPLADGITACARLQELPGGNCTPVLLVTALDDDKIVDLAFAAGASDYIVKPINFGVLRQRVNRLLHAGQTAVLLEKSETDARCVIENTLDGLITINEQGLIQSFNPAAESIFGYMAGEVIGLDIRQLMPGSYRKSDIYLPREQHDEQNKIKSICREITGRHKNGSNIPIELTISGFYAGDQRLFIVRDITKRKQVEEQLYNTQQQLLDIIEFLPDATVVIDNEKKVIAWNRAIEEMTGISKDDIIGKGDYAYAVPFYGRPRKGLLDLIFSPDEEIASKYKNFERKGNTLFARAFVPALYNGKGAYVWATASPLFDRVGNVVGAIESVRDITEYRQAGIELRMMAKVFESITNGIIVTDPVGKVQLANQTFTLIVGYSKEEVSGKHVRVFKSKRHNAQFYQKIRSSLKISGQWQGEIWVKRKNGEDIPVWLSSSAIKDEHGKITQYIGIFNDITEQVKLREERQQFQSQAARAQRLASLGIMSAGIAHEINQPLNSIKVLTDGMLYWHKRGQSQDLNKIFENLQKISAQAGRIDEIIKHMRSFVNNERTIQFAPCRLNEAVYGALDMLERQLSAHGIVVEKALSDNLPAVYGNESRLEEVVINLLVNAMQALDTVSRAEKTIYCSTWLEGEKVVLEISDNATGISSEIKNYIFEPFFSTKKAGEGMGLGLSIVQSVIFSFNGEIKVTNNEKGGTSFRIELPAIKNQAERSGLQ